MQFIDRKVNTFNLSTFKDLLCMKIFCGYYDEQGEYSLDV